MRLWLLWPKKLRVLLRPQMWVWERVSEQRDGHSCNNRAYACHAYHAYHAYHAHHGGAAQSFW